MRFLSKNSNRGFILGVVLLLCLVMAAFIFSYNSIVRSRTLQAHHYMASEVVSNLAVSGVKLLAGQVENSFEDIIKKDCPELFEKSATQITQPIILSSFNDFCKETQQDFQRFLNEIVELQEPGLISGGLPICERMEITIDQLSSLAPETSANQFQRGRDPVEKCGMINLTCVVKHMGLSRRASISQQFRIVSMVPGPFARFSLFVRKTPYPDSYNAMGVDFDGNVDLTYKHPPAGNISITAPLLVLNSTDTETITSTTPFRDASTDASNLRERGWIYLGASGPLADAPVYLKIPNGFAATTGGLFMFGWPSNSLPRLLAAASIDPATDFKKSEDISGQNFYLGSKLHGFYTCEEDNPQGVGAKNMWPGLTTGTMYQPSDRFLSASSWLYPFGNLQQSSRTLMIGPVLAGYLKYFFIKGSDTSGNDYRGLFGSLSPESFLKKQIEDSELLDYCYFWSGLLTPPVFGKDFFLNGYNSFKLLMPWNSLPDKNATSLVKGVAFNMIFDFMKYSRDQYPDPENGPSLAKANYVNQNILVPMAEGMQASPVKGVHPSGDMGLFFRENGDYNPNITPDNCYFFGDLAKISIAESNLVSNRITHIIDLSDCASTEEESAKVEKQLFKESKDAGKKVNEPRRSGIFLIRRRDDVTSSFADALTLSKHEINLTRPLIILITNGSLNISHDITSQLLDEAPEHLLTLALSAGDVYLTGTGAQRTIHAYIAAVGSYYGRLLKPVTMVATPDRFEIFGGLAVTELGLYQDKTADPRADVGSTMLHFPAGGKITYNSRFNPSLQSYNSSHILVMEQITGTLTIHGGIE